MCMVTFDWGETDAEEKVKKFEKTRSLSWAVIELTNLCNFNCLWCYANSTLKNQYMNKENAKKLVQILADAGIKQVTCSGGEPLMYPYIKEFVKDANEHGMVVHMNTNGYFLTKELAKWLYRLGLTQVQINIDSLNPKIHDFVRGKKGSFNRAIKALKNAKAVGLTCVSQTVLTKQNENEIIDIFRFARSMGIKRCRVWDMMPTGRATEKMDFRPSDYISTLKKLAEFAHETGAKNIETGEPLFSFVHETKLNLSGGFCPAFAGMFTIVSYQGNVYFCAAYRKLLYNIFNALHEDNINNLHNIRLREFMQSNEMASKCRECSFSKTCRGGCPARRGYESGGIDYWCKHRFIST